MLGHLSKDPLYGVLKELHFSASSGQLTLRKDDLDRKIYLQNGEIVLLSSSSPQERLGVFLLMQKLISHEALSRALQESTGGTLFGQFLVWQGYLSPEQLQEALVQFQAFLLARFLSASDASYIFVEGTDLVPPALAFSIPYANLFLSAARGIHDADLLMAQLGGDQQQLGFTRNPRMLFQNFSLMPEEYFIISRIQGISAMRDILALSPAGRLKTLQFLFALTACGILSPYTREQVLEEKYDKSISAAQLNLSVQAGTAAPAAGALSEEDTRHRDFILKIREKKSGDDHYDFMNLSRGATLQDIHARYLEYSKLLHPDNAYKPHLADLKPVLLDLSGRMDRAYETLSQSDRRSVYDKAGPGQGGRDSDLIKRKLLQQEISRRNFEKAKHYLEQEDWHSAYKLLKEASQFDPANPEILMALCRVEVRNPNWVRQATERLLGYLKDYPAFEDAWLLLAETYLAQNLPLRAVFYLEKVLEINPRHERARDLMRTIEKEKP